MSKLIPFITIDNAASAIEFYKEVFNAEVLGEITMLSNVPGVDQSKYQGKIGHCSLKISDSTIFINDSIEEYPLTPGDRIQLVLELESEETLKKAFEKLAKQGKIIEELQEVFWGALFGTVKDQYGVTWQIYYGHK